MKRLIFVLMINSIYAGGNSSRCTTGKEAVQEMLSVKIFDAKNKVTAASKSGDGLEILIALAYYEKLEHDLEKKLFGLIYPTELEDLYSL